MNEKALLSAEELQRRLSAEFPEAFRPDDGLSVMEVWQGGARVRRGFHPKALRPGGTISGTAMMELADATMYVAVLASIGWQPLAVTTNLNINFLKKPPARALICEGRLIKLGKRLAVGDLAVRTEDTGDLVAHATSTYSIPPREG